MICRCVNWLGLTTDEYRLPVDCFYCGWPAFGTSLTHGRVPFLGPSD